MRIVAKPDKVAAIANAAGRKLKTLTDVRDIKRFADKMEQVKKIVGAATGRRIDINKIATVWLDAVIKAGGLLREMAEAGERQKPGDDPRGINSRTERLLKPSLTDLGFTKSRASRWQLAEAAPKELRATVVAKILDSQDDILTLSAVLKAARQEKKRKRQEQMITAVFSADGPFDVVVIDPPWPIEKIDREVRPKQDEFDYPVMSEEELAKFWPEEIADKLNPDCHVFCWTTQKHLPTAIRLIERWGLQYVLTMVWRKSGGFQPIGLPQYNCEFAIYARQGSPIFINTKNFNCCFDGERREHSRKPDEFYDVIRRVTGGSRIDVFSREARDGFAQYGNETDKFVSVA